MSKHSRPEHGRDIHEVTNRSVPGSVQLTPTRSLIRLGIIGYMGNDNTHPYSWSAIINGDYNTDVMPLYANEKVTTYLNANRDSLGVENAQVTHVWTQDRVISERIVAASGVPQIAHEPRAMVDAVAAVLIARDDPESHTALAQPFLESGMQF